MKTFLVCDSLVHAEFVDFHIMESLRERDGSMGASWSGVFTDGVRFGVLWGNPASSLYDVPFNPETGEGDPAVVTVDEVLDADGESNWWLVESPEVPGGSP